MSDVVENSVEALIRAALEALEEAQRLLRCNRSRSRSQERSRSRSQERSRSRSQERSQESNGSN